MKQILILLNVVAALWLFFFSPAFPKAADSMRYVQVVELRQTGVINTKALQSQFPDAASPEGRLSLSLSHDSWYFHFFIWPASALALLNAAMIGFFWKTRSDERDSSRRDPEPPGKS